MNIIVDRENARFVKKLQRIFSDDATVEIVVEHPNAEKALPEDMDDHHQADSQPLKKNSLWA